jgi:hypothetical protein
LTNENKRTFRVSAAIDLAAEIPIPRREVVIGALPVLSQLALVIELLFK